jgi:hypothetical protein
LGTGIGNRHWEQTLRTQTLETGIGTALGTALDRRDVHCRIAAHGGKVLEITREGIGIIGGIIG